MQSPIIGEPAALAFDGRQVIDDPTDEGNFIGMMLKFCCTAPRHILSAKRSILIVCDEIGLIREDPLPPSVAIKMT
jgi:hypothetical protein